MSNINIIFYSKQCPACFKLIELIDKEGFLKYFKLLCVDGNLDKLPPQITAIPTMMVRQVNRPLGPEECFKWVSAMVNFRDKKKKEGEDGDIDGYSDLEFNRFSDMFTHIKKDDAFDQSFFKYKDEGNNAIHTAPLEGKLNSRDQGKRIKELEISRNQQDNKFKNDMKLDQREKIANAGKRKR